MCPKMDVNFWKIIAMLSLGFGSFIVAMIPGWYSLSCRSFAFLKTILLCFGGGVLISTSILHILPEVREAIPNTADFWFLGGYFLVYLMEELVHWFNKRKESKNRQINSLAQSKNRLRSHSNYGAMGNTDLEASQKFEDNVENVLNFVDHRSVTNDIIGNCSNVTKVDVHTAGDPHEHQKDQITDEISDDSDAGCSGIPQYHRNRFYREILDEIPSTNPNHVAVILVQKKKDREEHRDDTYPRNLSYSNRQEVHEEDEENLLAHVEEGHDKNVAGIVGMLVALLVHSCLEGFVIGLQSTRSQVIVLLTAVASHKYVVGFCLGGELAEAPGGAGSTTHVIGALLFSLGSVIGIGLGAVVLSSGRKVAGMMPALKGLAGGTLLYVALGEVVPRERALRCSGRPSTGVLQCLAIGVGVTLMGILNTYVHEPDEQSDKTSG